MRCFDSKLGVATNSSEDLVAPLLSNGVIAHPYSQNMRVNIREKTQGLCTLKLRMLRIKPVHDHYTTPEEFPRHRKVYPFSGS